MLNADICPTFKEPDDFLDWKFNFIKKYLKKYNSDIYDTCKELFECDDKGQQNTDKELVN